MKKIFSILAVVVVIILIIVSTDSRPKGVDNFKEPEKVEEKTRMISLNFVGDILPARAIELTMRKQGYDYPFQKIHEQLSMADITFANLESPLIGTATSGKTTVGGTTVFRADLDFADALKRAGIDIVSLANNHMKDQGQKGIASTLETLDGAGVAHAGAGLTLPDARQLRIMEIPGTTTAVKVGFLAYNDSDVVPPSYHATADQSGTHIMNIKGLQEDIALARPQVDLLIISMHSGTEYITTNPNSRQTEFAHAAVDAGADIVIGHHPHVLQPTEVYKGKHIYYSLGNFIFDQPWPNTKQSVLLYMQVKLSKSTSTSGWDVTGYYPDILPLKIVQFQPQKTTTLEEAAAIFNILKLPREVLTLGTNKILVEKVELPDLLQLGLSGRFQLSEQTGMLFAFPTPGRKDIWMKDMRFPLDIYWFDKDFKLTGMKRSVRPETYPDVLYGGEDDLYVLETAQGQFDQASLTKDLTGELTESNRYDKN